MPSTLGATTAYAAYTFSALAIYASVTEAHAHSPSMLGGRLDKRTPAMSYSGCYSSSTGLSDQGSYTYQTPSYCQPICIGKNQAVFGLSQGSNCWCGNELPPASSKVDDSNCNTPCNGYGLDDCGGTNYFSVYLTGTEQNVANAGGSSSSSSSSNSVSTSTISSSVTTSTPGATSGASTVVTSVAPGTTVVVTQPASQGEATGSPSTSSSKKSGGTNVAGVAAGVVVGVVAIAAIVAGLFFWLRYKRQRDAENEYKRSTQAADFLHGGREIKPPPTAYSQMSDSRLDPEAGRRNSNGSIADDQDYSRRILRVANPDHS
ncbi:hypothetical protein M433DRAFT_300 [Acidomyces richmondensis BFW]|nr:MAG: hypothetical protein FE78DRAFT_27833 [Acidomyces sp. 'richmondensis']KYG50352.1 hypothetical protein M433DRAFT_300 [Acidomyces richmondensis BFW]